MTSERIYDASGPHWSETMQSALDKAVEHGAVPHPAPFIVGFGHRAGVGKDSAGAALQLLGYERIGLADALKKIAVDIDPNVRDLVSRFGWDSVKSLYPRSRELLQNLGVAVREHVGPDTWVNAALRKAKPGGKYVITDVRFPNEAQAILDTGGRLYRIDRPSVKSPNHHISETALATYEGWHAVLVNDYPTEDGWHDFIREFFRRWVEPRFSPSAAYDALQRGDIEAAYRELPR